MDRSSSVETCTLAFFLGLTVKRLRTEKNYSQQDLANMCGLDRSYITLIEKGRKNPTLNIIEKIGNSLADSAAQFMAIVAQDTENYRKNIARQCEGLREQVAES
jgi:transcriptional regulator with XRE-family HTH domain